MPKQLGTYKVRGKMDGKSYYKPKNTEDYLFRSINQQMSERVKTEPKFAKTRAYAAEFGVCAELSKSIVSVFNRRFPNALARKENAPLTKLFKDILNQDQYHALGQRQLMGNTWQNSVITHLNNMSKSKPSAGGVIFPGCSIEVPDAQYNYDINVTLNVFIEEGAFSYLRQIGADSVRVYPFYFLSFGSRYFFDWPGYTEGVAYIFRKGSQTIGVDDGYDFLNNTMEIPSAAWYAVYRPTESDSSWQISRPGLYFEPIKHIGSSEVVLTQECGFVLGAFISSYDAPTPSIEYVEYNGNIYYPQDVAPTLNPATRNYCVVRVSGLDLTSTNVASVKINGVSTTFNKAGKDTLQVFVGSAFTGSPLLAMSISLPDRTLSISFNN